MATMPGECRARRTRYRAPAHDVVAIGNPANEPEVRFLEAGSFANQVLDIFVCALLAGIATTKAVYLWANPNASPHLQALPTSPRPRATLSSEEVLDASDILFDAPLMNVLTSVALVLGSRSGMLCSIFLLDETVGICDMPPPKLPVRIRTHDGCVWSSGLLVCAAATLRAFPFVADVLSPTRLLSRSGLESQTGLRASYVIISNYFRTTAKS